MKRILIPAIALASTLALQAQQAVKFTATKANEYGLEYSLPLTALSVTIEAEFTVKQPGEFARYASRYLNINDPIMEPSASASLKSASVTPVAVPSTDANDRYLITLKSAQSPYIILGEGNIPLAINTEETISAPKAEIPEARDAAPTPLQTPAANQVITQEMLQSQSSAKRAQLAAEQIYALRESRKEIITGQAENMPPDGSGMQLALENIEAQEQALLAMFVGTTSIYTRVATLPLITPDDNIKNRVIARISPSLGIVDADNLAGAPVYLSLEVTERGKLPVNEKDETLPFPKGGIAYRIPGRAECTIKYEGKVFDRQAFDMAQFGVVYGMNPANFTDKKSPIFLQFDPVTGAAAKTGPAN